MSDKPVAERLQVKNGRHRAGLGAPPGLHSAIGASATRIAAPRADVALLVALDRAGLDAALPTALAEACDTAILWLA